MTLLMLVVLLLVGGGLIYFLPATQKIVYFVWVVAVLIWVAGVFGVTSASIHAR